MSIHNFILIPPASGTALTDEGLHDQNRALCHGKGITDGRHSSCSLCTYCPVGRPGHACEVMTMQDRHPQCWYLFYKYRLGKNSYSTVVAPLTLSAAQLSRTLSCHHCPTPWGRALYFAPAAPASMPEPPSPPCTWDRHVGFESSWIGTWNMFF